MSKYYFNEYSLRGQFNDIEDFTDKLIEETIPVLKRIYDEEGNLIYKKDNLWNAKVCNDISLYEVLKQKRIPAISRFKSQLSKYFFDEPYWNQDDNYEINIKEYKFDEEYSCNFEKVNSFVLALDNEGSIISFTHPQYRHKLLSVIVDVGEIKDKEYHIDNVYNIHYWDKEQEIKKWTVLDKYLVQVRAKEFDYHPPHFHVLNNEYEAVFRLNDGKLYKDGNKKWTSSMLSEIKAWYVDNKSELIDAWENLHGKIQGEIKEKNNELQA